MNIAIAGAGFVGVVHAAAMASQEHKVVLFDVNESRINSLIDFCEGRTEELYIHEAGLSSLLKESYKKGLLEFTTNTKEAVSRSLVIFNCVGTPRGPDGKADLTYVESVATECGKVLQTNPGYKLFVNKSTVPVGTAKRVEDIIHEYYTGDFDVASNPETLAEGRAVRDATLPKRIIVGVNSIRGKKLFHDIYAPFFLPQQEKIFYMSPESAELTKYACNSFLGTQVVLTNILANIAKRTGANWRDMVPAILADVRIGKFVHPGLGFGGSCFRKDISQISHSIKDVDGSSKDIDFIHSLLIQNEHQKLEINRNLHKAYPNGIKGLHLAVWGLSFKKDTNDIRDAASLEVIPSLLARGVIVHAHDPKGIEEFKDEMARVGVDVTNCSFFTDKYQAIEGCDGLLILNDWKTYKQPDFNTLREKLKRKIIYDGKDLLNYRSIIDEADFSYYSICRPDILAKVREDSVLTLNNDETINYSQVIDKVDVDLYV
jgi:UDPglucose 6-dehydrogenase